MVAATFRLALSGQVARSEPAITERRLGRRLRRSGVGKFYARFAAAFIAAQNRSVRLPRLSRLDRGVERKNYVLG